MQKILGITGYSGSGKTTLLERLLPQLITAAIDVAVIKHTHHQQIDPKAGGDTERHRSCGVSQSMLVNDSQRWLNGKMQSLTGDENIFAHIAALAPCQLILIEGYKYAPIDKIEVINTTQNAPCLFTVDERVIAVVADASLETDRVLLLRDDIDGLYTFILDYLHHDTT